MGWESLIPLGIGAIGSLFGGKKKDQNVPDPLAGLRTQLQGLASQQQALAGQVPGQVAAKKALTAANMATARTEGMQGINENIRAERGFGNTSLQDRLNTELYDKLFRAQNAADLQADIWGTQQQSSILGNAANILSGTSSMYPGAAPNEGPSWQSQLMGAGTNMAVQNWMDENKWKNMGKYLGGSADTSGGGTSYLGSLISKSNPSNYLQFA